MSIILKKKRSINQDDTLEDKTGNELYISIEKSLLCWRNAIEEGAAALEEEVSSSEEEVAVVEFAERLRTFKKETYFSKPDCVSPLLAARLGWKNTARDMLTCSNPKCSASLCINFSNICKKRPLALQRLGVHYRSQLLEGHAQDCIFRYDAQCWFPENEEQTIRKDAVVPSYLLSVSPEMIIFENQSSDNVQIQLIYQTVLQKSSEFDNILVKINENCIHNNQSPNNNSMDGLALHTIEPEQLRNFISSQRQDEGAVEEEIQAPFLRSLLNEWCDDDDNIGRRYRTPESVLLATFGWTLLPITTAQKCQYLMVECPCCLSRAAVPITKNDLLQHGDAEESVVTAKRPRVQGLPTTKNASTRVFWRTAPTGASSIPPMNPLKCHRNFCPYLGGSLFHNQIGWEIVVRRMLQWKREQSTSKG